MFFTQSTVTQRLCVVLCPTLNLSYVWYRLCQTAFKLTYLTFSPEPVKTSNKKMAQTRCCSLHGLSRNDGKPIAVESNLSLNESRSTRTLMDVEEYRPLNSNEAADVTGEMNAKESHSHTLTQYWIECEVKNKKIRPTRRIDDQQYTVIEKINKGQILSAETIIQIYPNEVLAFNRK